MPTTPHSTSTPNFYPRPPRGGRPERLDLQKRALTISIHALREEGDQHGGDAAVSTQNISIHALREEGDPGQRWRVHACMISIHALREEGDFRRKAAGIQTYDFYPRPPRGGRRIATAGGDISIQFLSTPSARRATPPGHHPSMPHRDFYPRPPRGGRQEAKADDAETEEFLSTPSARRATR